MRYLTTLAARFTLRYQKTQEQNNGCVKSKIQRLKCLSLSLK